MPAHAALTVPPGRRIQALSDPTLQIGCSGWVYSHWERSFYPRPLPEGVTRLDHYARHFPTVEINYSFYNLPEREQFEQWRDGSPPGFVFAVKGSRYLTHMKKLKDPEEPLARLLERSEGLGEKRGPILFQFPRTWGQNLERLRDFVPLLAGYPQAQFVFEFRHAAWLVPEVYALLERAGAALCIPIGAQSALDVTLTAPWSYLRFHNGEHGVGYSRAELERWAGVVEDFRNRGAAVYAYFNNDTGGHALADAFTFADLLGAST